MIHEQIQQKQWLLQLAHKLCCIAICYYHTVKLTLWRTKKIQNRTMWTHVMFPHKKCILISRTISIIHDIEELISSRNSQNNGKTTIKFTIKLDWVIPDIIQAAGMPHSSRTLINFTWAKAQDQQLQSKGIKSNFLCLNWISRNSQHVIALIQREVRDN